MIKSFVDNHSKLLKIIAIAILTPITIYIVVSLMQVVFTIGNYVGTFLRGVYSFFVC